MPDFNEERHGPMRRNLDQLRGLKPAKPKPQTRIPKAKVGGRVPTKFETDHAQAETKKRQSTLEKPWFLYAGNPGKKWTYRNRYTTKEAGIIYGIEGTTGMVGDMLILCQEKLTKDNEASILADMKNPRKINGVIQK